MHSLGENKGVAESMVKSNCNVASDFNVLALVFAYWHLVSVVEQDVCCLQCGIRKEASRNELAFTFR